jgi:hypothetical protein
MHLLYSISIVVYDFGEFWINWDILGRILPEIFANSYKSGINFRNTQFSLRMRKIYTSHKHYNNFCRIYIENVLKFSLLEEIYVGISVSKL